MIKNYIEHLFYFFLRCEPNRRFYFFFLQRGQKDPCRSSSTKQYTECGLIAKQTAVLIMSLKEVQMPARLEKLSRTLNCSEILSCQPHSCFLRHETWQKSFTSPMTENKNAYIVEKYRSFDPSILLSCKTAFSTSKQPFFLTYLPNIYKSQSCIRDMFRMLYDGAQYCA